MPDPFLPCRICTGTGLTRTTSPPRPGSPVPHPQWDRAHSFNMLRARARPFHLCTGTGLAPAGSAPVLDMPLPCHICAGTGLTPATSASSLGSPLPPLHWDPSPPPVQPLRCDRAQPCRIGTMPWARLTRLHEDPAHPCHIGTETGLTPTTQELAPGSPLPHRHRAPARPAPRASALARGPGTDLPLKGQFFHREAENRPFRRPRDAKNSILNEF